jgi:hypothetical protein
LAALTEAALVTPRLAVVGVTLVTRRATATRRTVAAATWAVGTGRFHCPGYRPHNGGCPWATGRDSAACLEAGDATLPLSQAIGIDTVWRPPACGSIGNAAIVFSPPAAHCRSCFLAASTADASVVSGQQSSSLSGIGSDLRLQRIKA